MNLRFIENYQDQPIEYLFEPCYPQFGVIQEPEQNYERFIFDNNIQNNFLDALDYVKKEEDNYYIHQDQTHYIDQYEDSLILNTLAQILKISKLAIEQICTQNPLNYQRLIEKAKRIIRREKAKLRSKVRMSVGNDQQLEMMEEQLKCEDFIHDLGSNNSSQVSSYDEKSKKKQRSLKKSIYGRKNYEKKLKIEESDHIQSISDRDSQLGTVTSVISEASTENEKQQKKMVQMIRNRISAQNSRDRKKAYIHELEQNTNQVNRQNANLQLKIKDYQEQNESITKQNNLLKKQLDEVKQKLQNQKNQNIKEIQPQDQSASQKITLKKIGLTILTMASVYLMMNKCQDAENNQISPKIQTTTNNIEDWNLKNDIEPKILKKVNTGPILEPNQSEITDNLTSQICLVQNQMKQFIHQNYQQELDIRQFSDKENLIKMISNMEFEKYIGFESIPLKQKNFEEP